MQCNVLCQRLKSLVLSACWYSLGIHRCSDQSLNRLKNFHTQHQFDVTFVSALVQDPGSYGRLIRDEDGNALKIVEAANATPEELSVCEVNTGAAMFEMAWLRNIT